MLNPGSGAVAADTDARRCDIFGASSTFGCLSEPARLLLGRLLQTTELTNQEIIYLQDDYAEHLFCVLSGHVRLSYMMEDGSTVLHDILGPGKYFGELGIFDRGVHADTATAVGNVVLAGICIRAFHGSQEHADEIRGALCKLIAQRYRSYVEVTRNLSLGSLGARLSQALLRLAHSLGEHGNGEHQGSIVIGPMVTQSDLGAMARGTRGNVNRYLKTWEQAGWVSLQNRRIYIKNKGALEMLAFESDISE